MATESRYDILFEPVQIGPVTAPNRFYQVPHCNGMGHEFPRSLATMRGIKAEGGWGVVCTEMMELHHTSDVSPGVEGRLWDDMDIPALQLMTEAVHEHGSLAGIELAYSGYSGANLYSRVAPLAPSHISCSTYGNAPVQARAMTKKDIRQLRQWYREAALRSKRAGFDIVYVYAGHALTILMHFLSRRHNQRTDEYGGSLENRVRLFREVIEETKEAVGDTCAVAVRFAVDELLGGNGITAAEEGRDVVEMLADLPDLWDVNIADWSHDSATSRFEKEGYQEPYINFVKEVTSKPVVGVGRFTSADAMVSLVRRGVVDLVGAARPSIADPFLPNKIREGRFDDIRECIGCNICVSADQLSVPIRCTQNPTMGEEWRRDWHPESIAPRHADETVLVVGAGPAGLEFTQSMGKRGYNVILAEATKELGGRVLRESQLPGLSEWVRVADYRQMYINQAPNIEVYRDSRLSAEDILSFGISNVFMATGAHWRRDGVGRASRQPIEGLSQSRIYTPDDIMAETAVQGRVVIYDDDHYYMGGVIAEKLVKLGLEVALVTPAAEVSSWTHNTLEQFKIQSRLLEMGVSIYCQQNLVRVERDYVELGCVYTGKSQQLACDSLVLVTERLPNDSVYQELLANPEAVKESGIDHLQSLGDCLAPGIIAQAVFSGHQAAREFGEPHRDGTPFKREITDLIIRA
ncbi:NADH:flavin oxidoreductase [Pseudomaricurvus alkylphenolicus]|uniref:oxidoreductase n=1 Tax=Pseudomaricurvus alkylphenolicus TaxID=1306991 RepID=UPI001420F1DD|nr:FAD-dependent oxidoreductase [Pseudomaricurvus alkylphenolicus]NIB42190.1 NADH:flavin oxidoreductase [Pseudomaricurvus alkylphenolicus]